jgi:16S rRNA (cytosine967-C5)-methyltransferase
MKQSERLHFRGRPTARSVALSVLLTVREGDAFVQEVLDAELQKAPLSPADRRLATTLAYGVLRRRGTLDALLRPCVNRQPHQVEPWLWEALRLGAYQLVLLTHIPPHAALNETVELAVQVNKPRGKGFLNGVLRKVSGLITTEFTECPAADAVPMDGRPHAPREATLPHAEHEVYGSYRHLSQPVLPDPATSPVEYLSAAFALPRWLVQRWRQRFSWDECLLLGFWFAGPAPLWLRCNTLRTDRDSLLLALAQAGVKAEPGDHPLSVRVLDGVPIRELPGYAEGWFAVQDYASLQPATALNPQPGQRGLDLCAAPGGKTTQLAALMKNEGELIACDMDAERLQTLEELCRRLGVTVVTPRLLRPKEDPPAGPFDAILVDVPCSNTGVLGRRPEVRWRLKPDDLPHLVTLQTKLLLLAGERVKPGGVVVYSTCSIEPEENRGVVEAVLRGLPDLKLEAEETQVPGQPGDGGYWARLRRP